MERFVGMSGHQMFIVSQICHMAECKVGLITSVHRFNMFQYPSVVELDKNKSITTQKEILQTYIGSQLVFVTKLVILVPIHNQRRRP